MYFIFIIKNRSQLIAVVERSFTFENNSSSKIDVKIIGLPPELLNRLVRVIVDLRN